MLKKEMIISLFVGLLLICMSGIAFASDVGSEAGMKRMSVSQSTLDAAQSHDYSMLEQAKVGTEAGNWEYNFDTPQTKNEVAAQKHQYDQRRLEAIGTEAGTGQLRDDLICPTC